MEKRLKRLILMGSAGIMLVFLLFLMTDLNTAQAGNGLSITQKSPYAGQDSVALTTSVKIVFSVPVNEATLTEDTIRVVKDDDDSPVVGGYSISYSSSDNTAAIIFKQSLAEHTTYRITVTTGVKAVDGGSSLAVPETWTFSTISTQAVIATPFRIEIKKGTGEWVDGSSIPSMGVYYYYPGQSIDFRLYPVQANLPPANYYSIDAPALELTTPSGIQTVRPVAAWNGTGSYWAVSYPLPAAFTDSGARILQPKLKIPNNNKDIPAAIMVAVLNINPKDMSFGLAGETTDWETITDFTRISSLKFEKYADNTRIATLILGDTAHPINACAVDPNGNATTATAMQQLQQNLDMAWNKVSINTSAGALAAFNQPAVLILYNLPFAQAPGVKYIPSSGAATSLILPGTKDPVDPSGKISHYLWDPVSATLTLQVNGWSGYEVYADNPPDNNLYTFYTPQVAAVSNLHEWKITFSQAVDDNSLTGIKLWRTDPLNPVTIQPQKDSNNSHVVWVKHNQPYSQGAAYTLYIDQTVKSTSGTALTPPRRMDFTVK